LKVHAVILAAGKSTRFKEDKLFSIINEFPLIKYPIDTFLNSLLIDSITITANPQNISKIESIFSNQHSEKITFIKGGKSRNESEFIALNHLKQKSVSDNDLVVIHDAARAFLSTELLEKLILHAIEFGSASPYLHSGILVDKNNILTEKEIVEIQTPQVFDFKCLIESYEKAAIENFHSLDTTECVSKYTNITPQVIEGELVNKKITYKKDIDEIKEIIGI